MDAIWCFGAFVQWVMCLEHFLTSRYLYIMYVHDVRNTVVTTTSASQSLVLRRSHVVRLNAYGPNACTGPRHGTQCLHVGKDNM
jgi:hypothetical protein